MRSDVPDMESPHSPTASVLPSKQRPGIQAAAGSHATGSAARVSSRRSPGCSTVALSSAVIFSLVLDAAFAFQPVPLASRLATRPANVPRVSQPPLMAPPLLGSRGRSPPPRLQGFGMSSGGWGTGLGGRGVEGAAAAMRAQGGTGEAKSKTAASAIAVGGKGDKASGGGVAVVLLAVLLKVARRAAKKVLRLLFRLDVQLIVYFFLWYAGNYYHNITGKIAFNMSGGAMGFPVTIATMQMGIGCLYALFMWGAPDARKFPNIRFRDIITMLPVAFCNAGVHGFSSFATSAGAISFGQMIKASEPAFAAVIGTTVYGKGVSTARWMCLIPIIGGVSLASVTELNFAWLAFWAAGIANIFAAFKGQENAKLMASGEIRDRLETVGNQFALTTLASFLFMLPVMVIKEGSKWPQFYSMLTTNPVWATNFVLSGLLLYGYNECATITIKKTSAITQSVANTAKRAVVIVGSALVFGESLGFAKLMGCSIALGGVLLYSVIDTLLHKAAERGKAQRFKRTIEILDMEQDAVGSALSSMVEVVGAAAEDCVRDENGLCEVSDEESVEE